MSYCVKAWKLAPCLLWLGICLAQSSAQAQLIFQADFEPGNDNYELIDEGYEPDTSGAHGDSGPGIWGLNTDADRIGLLQNAPANRAAVLWDHTPLPEDFVEEALNVWVSLVDWSVGVANPAGRSSIKIGFFPGYVPESVDLIKSSLVDAGYVDANISEILDPFEAFDADIDLLIHTSEVVAPNFASLPVPLISFSASDHDDAAIAGIGAAVAFPEAVTLEIPEAYRNHPALGGHGADGVIEWTNTGVQLQTIGKTHNGGRSIALVEDPTTEELGPAIYLVEKGSPVLGAFNPDPEGDRYIVGAALNKFGTAAERQLEIGPIDVAGKTDVKLTVALAATAADFELDDYLRIEIDPDGNGPAAAQPLEEFWGVNDPLSDCNKGLSNGELAGELGSICLPTEAFGDFTFDIPDGATNLVVRFAALSTWGNEIVAFDNIRIYTGELLSGDFNGNGQLDSDDLDLLAVAQQSNDLAYDLNSDGVTNYDDRVVWVRDLKKTWIGDADLNGEFNSADFVAIFTAGEYEDLTAGNSKWDTGDWNGDGDFNSSDFVAAFSDGGYELGPRAATIASVPEPGSLLLLTVGLLALAGRRRRA